MKKVNLLKIVKSFVPKILCANIRELNRFALTKSHFLIKDRMCRCEYYWGGDCLIDVATQSINFFDM